MSEDLRNFKENQKKSALLCKIEQARIFSYADTLPVMVMMSFMSILYIIVIKFIVIKST